MPVFFPRILPPRRRAMLSPLPIAETFWLPCGPVPGHSATPYSATADPVHPLRDALTHSHDCLAGEIGERLEDRSPVLPDPSGEQVTRQRRPLSDGGDYRRFLPPL